MSARPLLVWMVAMLAVRWTSVSYSARESVRQAKRKLTIDENGVDSLLLERLDGLRSRVVELSSLTDGESSRTENEDLANVNARVGGDVVDNVSAGHRDGADELLASGRLEALDDRVEEDVEEELGVAGTGSRLGVELDGEHGALGRVDSLIGAVVGIDEELPPSRLQSRDVHGVSVVLRGDVAATRDERGTGNVGSTVSVLELEGRGSRGASEKLVTEADTEDGEGAELDGLGEVGGGSGEGGGVAGSVRDEKPIEGLLGRGEVVVVPGNDLELDSTLDEAANLVVLHSDVDAEDAKGAAGGVKEGSDGAFWLEEDGGGHRDGSDEVVAVGVVVLDRLVSLPPGGSLSVGDPLGDATDGGSTLPQLLGEIPGVDSVDGGDALLLEPVGERRVRLMVRPVVVGARV